MSEYRMDECEWQGIAGEVTDSVAGSYNATARNSARTVEAAQMCRAADFTGEYVQLQTAMTLPSRWSMSAWVKFPLTPTSNQFLSNGKYYFVLASASSTGDLAFFTLSTQNNTYGWGVYASGGGGGSGSQEASTSQPSAGWHHVAVVNNGSQTTLYLDGSSQSSVPIRTTGQLSMIGTSVDDPANQTIGGLMDEVIFFDSALSSGEIVSIYNNQNGGKNWDGSSRTCTFCGALPVADYHMDACAWEGSPSEVIDSSGNGWDGTANSGATTESNASVSGGICRVGVFDGVDDYIAISGFSGLLNATASLGFWINTTQTGNYNPYSAPGIAGIEENGGTDDIFWGWLDSSGYIGITAKSDDASVKSSTRINDGNWHHVVLTRQSDTGVVQVFVDGVLEDSGTQGTGTVGNAFSGLGRIENTNGSELFFTGMLDEVMVFDSVLPAAAVQAIYDNQTAKKGYDGSARSCAECVVCGIYDGELASIQMVGEKITLLNTYSTPQMTQVTYKDNYVFSQFPVIFILPNSNGGNPASMRVKNVDSRGFEIAIVEPQGEDGAHVSMSLDYFAVNVGNKSGSSGSQVFRLGDQFIEVGYIKTTKVQKGYDTAPNAWETISTKVPFCNPVVAVQVQGMENEPTYNPAYRSIPFLSVAVDTVSEPGTIKLALERSETNEGMIAQPEMIAYMIAEANVADSFADDDGNTIAFETIKTGDIFYGWDDSPKTSVAFQNGYASVPLVAASLNSRHSQDGGWFRKASHTTSKLTLVVDEDRYNGGRNGAWSGQDAERSKKDNHGDTTPTPEAAGVFVFEGVFKKTGEVELGTLNAVDADQKTFFEGTLTTKIDGGLLDIALVAREEDNVTRRDANISLVELVDCADDLCLDCLITSEAQTLYDAAADGGTINIDAATGYALLQDYKGVVLPRSGRVQKIRLTEQVNGFNQEPVCSHDTFATRPLRIGFVQPSAGELLVAEHAYTFTGALQALRADGASVASGYDAALLLDATKRMRNGENNDSLSGMLTQALSAFSAGVADLNLSFSDVADIGLEYNDTSWTQIDVGDTPEAQRTVYGEQNVTFIPHHFQVAFVDAPLMEDNDTINALTYLSNDLNMSGWLRNLSVDITAQGESGGTLSNYSDPKTKLFANLLDIAPQLLVAERHSAAVLSHVPVSQSGLDLEFSGGVATYGIVDAGFNYARDYSHPTDPFTVAGNEANISVAVQDVLYASVEGLASTDFSGETNFYYGRIRPLDVKTNLQRVVNPIPVEVYDSTASLLLSGFTPNLLNWYENIKHLSAANGAVHEAQPFAGAVMSGSADATVAAGAVGYAPAIVNVEINSSDAFSKQRLIHLGIDSWLWYVPEGFGSAYLFGSGSDCTQHPCFEYIYEALGGGGGLIESGDFNGSDFGAQPIDINISLERQQGIRLFR